MAEHHTQGRQGQGARRRRNNNQNRRRRQRMPRPEATPARKPSLLQRILSFFGFKKKEKEAPKREKNQRNNPPQKVRVAKTNNNGGNPASGNKGRRRATSTPPTRNARLYVGNLSYEANESELEDLFKGFGNVKSVEIIYNPRTHKSKGYAFVEMRYLDDARKAAEVLHGQPFMGRELMVSAASERPDTPEKAEQTNTPEENSATEAPAETPEATPEETPAETPAAEEQQD